MVELDADLRDLGGGTGLGQAGGRRLDGGDAGAATGEGDGGRPRSAAQVENPLAVDRSDQPIEGVVVEVGAEADPVPAVLGAVGEAGGGQSVR